MKIKTMMPVLISILLLSACSSFRETGLSDDGSIRQIMTEHTEEIELPADPERIVLFRSIDPGNAELLDGEVVGVNANVSESETADAFMDEDITYLEHGDLEGLAELEPDLIITYTPDEYFFEYEKIAPTVQVNYSTSTFSPFGERLYLTHLFNLGVIINKQEEAEKLGDAWLEEETRLQREVADITADKSAVVLVEQPDGFSVYGEYTSFGTEAVYDVLKFNMDDSVSEALENGRAPQSVDDLGALDSDYVFVNVREEDGRIRKEIAESMDIPQENVILLDYDDYRLNDLTSVKVQTEEIIEQLK